MNKRKLYYNCFCKNIWEIELGRLCPRCGNPTCSWRPFYVNKPAKGVEEHEFLDGETIIVYDTDIMFEEYESYDDGNMLIGDFDEVMDKLGF